MSRNYKYLEIRNRILDDVVRSGGGRVPSESEICAQFEVSRTTAIKALNSLAKDSLVRREVGRGTFLNAPANCLTISVLVDRFACDFQDFLREIGQRYREIEPLVNIEVVPVGSRGWIEAIASKPGVKVLLTSHTGYLASMGVLLPLSRLACFDRIACRLRMEYVHWRKVGDKSLECYALPVNIDPLLFGYNRVLAQEVGLDAQNGPQSLEQLPDWLHRAQGAGVCKAMLHQMLPLSEYLSLSSGRPLLREENDELVFEFQMLEDWIELFRALHATGGVSMQKGAECDPFVQGRSLVGFGLGGWALAQSRANQATPKLCLRQTLPAVGGGGAYCHISLMEAALAAGPIGEREQNAAGAFLEYLLADAGVHRTMLRYRSTLSANRTVYEEQQADPDWIPYVQALSMGRVRCDHPTQHRLLRIIAKYFFAAVGEQISCKESARRIRESCLLHMELETEPELRESLV